MVADVHSVSTVSPSPNPSATRFCSSSSTSRPSVTPDCSVRYIGNEPYSRTVGALSIAYRIRPRVAVTPSAGRRVTVPGTFALSVRWSS